MKLMLLLSILCLVCSCKTSPTGETVPDWGVWEEEMRDIQGDLGDLAQVYPDEQELFDNLTAAAKKAEDVAAALDAGTGEYEAADFITYVEAGITAAEGVYGVFEKDPERLERVQLYVALLKILLRRTKRYIGDPEEEA